MRPDARRGSRRPARSAGNTVYWVLAVLLIALLGWIWWRSGKSATPAPAPSHGTIPSQAATNAPPPTVRTNLPTALPNRPPPNLVMATSLPPSRATNVLPPGGSITNAAQTDFKARPVQNIYEAQLIMARQGISSGSLDGVPGSQTRAALRAYQTRENLPVTGALDTDTKASMVLSVPPYAAYTVTAADLERLQPVSPTWLGKSQQSALDYETILELVSEKGQAHPGFVKRLNPEINWTNVIAGTTVQIPNVGIARARGKAAFVIIHLADKNLEAFDASTNLLAHFPCSIAQRVEKRPVGELHVAVVAPNPNYTFDPEVFPESAEARELKRKLILPPGPNNPVGAAWIGLDKPGYGIHGTPRPEDVGRTESHGCFRLANWNAEYLARMVTMGMPVYVE